MRGKQLAELAQNALTRDYTDEFILRLRQVNTGMYRKGNAAAIRHAFKAMPEQGAVLEIGAFTGLSTNIISYLLTLASKPHLFFTCDPWDYAFKKLSTGTIGRSNITGQQWGDFVRETFTRNVSFFSRERLPYAMQMPSAMFFDHWKSGAEGIDVFGRTVRLGGPVAFCFIDGDHAYAPAKDDFTLCDQHLLTGGFILFDDSARFTGSPGVQRLMKELRRSRVFGTRYEVVTQAPNYLIRRR